MMLTSETRYRNLQLPTNGRTVSIDMIRAPDGILASANSSHTLAHITEGIRCYFVSQSS